MHQIRNKKSSNHSAKPQMASLMLLVMILAATAASTVDCLSAIPGCQGVCGGVEIPYPFGIGSTCSRKGFEIKCNNNGSAGEIPVLPAPDQNIPVLHLSVSPFPEARVLLPVAWRCFNSTGNATGIYQGNVDFNREGVYRISNTANELFVLGCNTYAYANGVRVYDARFRYKYNPGCITITNDKTDLRLRDGACAGLGCCHVDIPPGITDTSMTMSGWSHANQEFCPCDFAFIVEKGNYTFKASDLLSTHIPKTMPQSVDWTMPLRLDWAIRDNGSTTSISCAQAPNKPGHEYACRSNHSMCIDSTNGPGYFCNCTNGYQGNPYVVGGCTNINECILPGDYPCYGECKDTDGSYECKCRPGYGSDGDPKEKPCRSKLPSSAKRVIGITVGASVLFLIILVTAVCCMLKRIEQKAKEREQQAKEREEQAKEREQQAIERKNGSEILKNVKTLMIFTKEELDKITENNAVLLGKGGFGEVHKGQLPDSDKTEVAVKASIAVTAATRDNFVKEVEIQSRMMHRNILKLLGCCLRVDVPLLVYEYAANGNLKDILHGKNNQRQALTLGTRLDIAIGSAQGLAYMHSYTENGIQHADVKPDNILLDAGMVPKISDFGLSRVSEVGKDFATKVVGYLPYMDPVYKNTGRLTPKSDVYSFGIILLELISRRPVTYGEDGLVMQFKSVYEKHNTGMVLFDKDIAEEQDIPILDEIGKLAMKCLRDKFDERPAMASVASALVILKDSWEETQKRVSSINQPASGDFIELPL